MPAFDQFHFHVGQEADLSADVPARAFRAARPSRFATDDAAARFYLDQVLATRDTEEFRDIVAPESPARVPGLTHIDVQRSPVPENRVVRFHQTHRGVPIFGSRVVVELGTAQALVSVDLTTKRVQGDPIATLAPADVVSRLAREVGLEADFSPRAAPRLVFFGLPEDDLTLAYLVRDVPALPPPGPLRDKPLPDGALDSGAPEAYEFFLDADSGEILFAYPSGPTLDIASLCRGVDDLGVAHEFHGRQVGDRFEMTDPDRRVTTHDIAYGNIVGAATPPAVSALTADWEETNRAAVSAHVNATRVHDFYESVLHRKGIDDKGMALVSVVNCTKEGLASPPEWINAQWRAAEGRMIYGQRHLEDGALRSLATFLDVIAHELTHGVTTHTAELVYKDQTGALNESMSDIFGVIVNNWYLYGEHSDIDGWDWEIGPGLGSNGRPLRDAAQPTRCQFPDHMRTYQEVHWDYGGVHINSGIHTLAAVHVLRSRDANGVRHFTPRQVAGFYYSTLQRLGSHAKFADARELMVNVVATRYAGFPDEAAASVAAVESAYDAVGIAAP